jgi:hypothetical protein
MKSMARARRKGKPYNPAEKVHDRRSQDLLKNARVAIDEVDDPYAINPGDKIVVLRSTRNDPLADMKSKNQIDQCDYVAGRHWQAAYENAELGNVRAIDPGKESVDGGRLPEMLTDQQRRAVQDLNAASVALGPEGNALVVDVLAKGWSISQAALQRGRTSERDKLYVGARFRECLSTLAKRFGYATHLTTPVSTN